jgi:hypothetical protein
LFEIIGDTQDVRTIASGRRLRVLRRLNRQYGRGAWRKMKGTAIVRLRDGTILRAELHWYEAHGIGKKEIKFKRFSP